MDINLPMDPPVNNNIQHTLYDKLDAMVFERVSVANNQLNSRLSIQEKVIAKYRRDAQKIHENQSKKLKREFEKIRVKKPDYVYDDSLVMESKRKQADQGRIRSKSEYDNNTGHCRRYYAHHFNLKPLEKNEDKEKKKQGENDFFNLKLRLYFLNMMNKAVKYSNPAGSEETKDEINLDSVAKTADEVLSPDICNNDVFESSDLGSSFNSNNRLNRKPRSISISHTDHDRSKEAAEARTQRRLIRARRSLQDLTRKDGSCRRLSSRDFKDRKERWKQSKDSFQNINVDLF